MARVTPRTIVSATGETVTIRSALPDDAIVLLAYVRAVAAETPFLVIEADEFNFTEEQERSWIQERMDDPGKLVLVAEIAGILLGGLGFENGPYRRIVHRGTFGISVARPWRGKGIGTALLQALLDWAEASPLIEKVGLAVSANNEGAIRLYKRLGFAEEGRRPREMKLGPRRYMDDILMYRLVKRDV
jgi:RimJ/RimL family protein N-acetyltransferase